jgi:hypothetical protein
MCDFGEVYPVCRNRAGRGRDEAHVQVDPVGPHADVSTPDSSRSANERVSSCHCVGQPGDHRRGRPRAGAQELPQWARSLLRAARADTAAAAPRESAGLAAQTGRIAEANRRRWPVYWSTRLSLTRGAATSTARHGLPNPPGEFAGVQAATAAEIHRTPERMRPIGLLPVQQHADTRRRGLRIALPRSEPEAVHRRAYSVLTSASDLVCVSAERTFMGVLFTPRPACARLALLHLRNRKLAVRSPRYMTRLRACWAVHSAVGPILPAARIRRMVPARTDAR